MAKNYTIQFKSLRAGTTYVVNIGGGTGTPVPLKAGANPFVTQESDDDDMFTPIRTQSGYLRIVDDGYAADGVTPFDWKDLTPATDTERPVTLTANGSVVWRGFMQAQDFGSTLYGNPQEREFPVQCVLTVTQGTDINYQQTDVQNFAYLLKQIVDAIPVAQRPTYYYIQGGSDAQQWLLKCIDWQNFVSEDGDGNLMARFSCYDCLRDMCAFWGFTARTHADSLYLTMADMHATEAQWLKLDYTALTQMANGSTAGTVSTTFNALTLTGDVYASTNNDEYVQRGHNKSEVTADTNPADETVVEVFTDKVVKQMEELGKQGVTHNVRYTNDLLTVNSNFLKVTCREGYASLNTCYLGTAQDANTINVIRIKKTGGNNVTPYAQIETVYSHNFGEGFLMMYGQVYRFAEEYLDPFRDWDLGRSYMYARIGIGPSRANAKWWNGRSWQSTQTYCRLSIGNRPVHLDDSKNEFYFLYLQETQASSDDWGTNILPIAGLYGKIYIDLLGTSNDRVGEIDGERSFELRDFNLGFLRNNSVVKYPADNGTKIKRETRPTVFSYKSSNQNSVRNEWNYDCIYATENKCKFGYGQIFNPDGTLFESVSYGNEVARPEQKLADRVTTFWQTSRRRIASELRTNVVGVITPLNIIEQDGTTGYPIAISHDWWNDVTMLTILEV